MISNSKSYCYNDTFTDLWITSVLAKNVQEAYKLFLKFSFRLVTFSKSYVRKHKWLFFF